MKTRIVVFVFALAILVALAAPAFAGDKEVSLEGNIACAKCTLKVEGQNECQTVLVVGDQYYYIVKNDVAEEFGHVCKGEKAAMVTGTVEEKDGKMWLTATKMTAPDKA